MAEVSGLEPRENIELLQVVPDKILELKTSVNFALCTFSSSFSPVSLWQVEHQVGSTPNSENEKFLGSAPSLTSGRLLSLPSEEQKDW